MSASTKKITGILLAAGMGQRFKNARAQAGFVSEVSHHKLLHPLFDGRSILQHSAEKFSQVCPNGLIVFSARAEPALQHALSAQVAHLPLRIVFCPDAETGMAASLVHALQYSKTDSAAWLIALADMPFIRTASYEKVLHALREGADIVAPTFQHRRGHPIGISRRYLADLLELRGDVGARSILQREVVLEIEVDDAGILRDIDTLADL
jgi:molybdenum cofactor cytidylyltransferase